MMCKDMHEYEKEEKEEEEDEEEEKEKYKGVQKNRQQTVVLDLTMLFVWLH